MCSGEDLNHVCIRELFGFSFVIHWKKVQKKTREEGLSFFNSWKIREDNLGYPAVAGNSKCLFSLSLWIARCSVSTVDGSDVKTFF